MKRDKTSGLWSHIRLQTTYTLGEANNDTESGFGVSQTVPDQALSLTELLYRSQRGLPIPQKTAIYTEENLPDLSKLDLVEIQELKDHARFLVDSKRAELQQAQETERLAVQAEKERQIQAAIAAKKAQQNQPAPPAAAE